MAEVSSFQLESIRSFKPRIALIINISPDHLDRYFSMDEYAEAKLRIFANQVRATRSSEISMMNGSLRWPARAERASRPARCGFRANRTATRRSIVRNGEKIVYAPPTGDPRPVDIMDVDEIPLQGEHNVDNVARRDAGGLAAASRPQEAWRAA